MSVSGFQGTVRMLYTLGFIDLILFCFNCVKIGMLTIFPGNALKVSVVVFLIQVCSSAETQQPVCPKFEKFGFLEM